MYVAELKGKLSSRIERSEDVLTSNVFSFFKYAPRGVFLRRLLKLLHIGLTDDELENAEFIFWPTYEDGTEPDLVLLAGRYYLLFEAKYFSDFGTDDEKNPEQIFRELEEGFKEAAGQNREFILVAVTADNNYPSMKFDGIPPKYRHRLKWINWQSIAGILLEVLENRLVSPPTIYFAEDLYNLLDKKRLRGFLSYNRLRGRYTGHKVESIFFSVENTDFRGQSIGFDAALAEHTPINKHVGRLFYSKKYFSNLPNVNPVPGRNIFYGGEGDE